LGVSKNPRRVLRLYVAVISHIEFYVL
jgi:hypothetical protein